MTGQGTARLSPSPGLATGQATQVVSHGRHHHNRLSVVSEPWSSGLNARAGSPQNRHSGPPPARASIHPVVLAVAACTTSNLGVMVLRRRGAQAGLPGLHPHQFRHTFAHQWLAQGGAETDLMRIAAGSPVPCSSATAPRPPTLPPARPTVASPGGTGCSGTRPHEAGRATLRNMLNDLGFLGGWMTDVDLGCG